MIGKLIDILPKGYKKQSVWVSGSILLSSILDLAGIAVILPIFILLLNGGELGKYPFLKKLMDFLSPDGNISGFVLWLGLITILILCVKFILSQILQRYQTKYVLGIYRYFSSRLFKEFYGKGLSFIKDNGTVDLTYKINAVCYNAATLVLMQILSLVAESVVTIVTFALIATISPVSAIAIVISLTPSVLVYFIFVRDKLIQYGRLENRARSNQYRTVQETFRNWGAVKIYGAFDKMMTRFNSGLDAISYRRLKSILIGRITSFLMELSIIICICFLILTSGQQWSTLSLWLALFCAGAIRILPAFRSILGSYSSIKNNNYAIEIICNALEGSKEKTTMECPVEDSLQMRNKGRITFNKCIGVENLTFYFNPNEPVLENVSFEIHKGERVGFRGVSGRGKSTLFNLMLGLYEPVSGRVSIDGVTLSKENTDSWLENVGYVPQDVQLLGCSIAENVAFNVLFDVQDNKPLTVKELLTEKQEHNQHFHIEPDILERVMEALKQAQLLDFVNSLEHGIYTVIGEGGCKVSGGQKQRLGIARALYKRPQVLFLDEATSSLDSKMESEVNKAVEAISKENSNLTIITIAHRESSLAFCNRVIEL